MVTPQAEEAVALAAESGLKLETTYTGKAFSAMLDDARHGRLRPDERVLFWDTYSSAAKPASGAIEALPPVLRDYIAECDRALRRAALEGRGTRSFAGRSARQGGELACFGGDHLADVGDGGFHVRGQRVEAARDVADLHRVDDDVRAAVPCRRAASMMLGSDKPWLVCERSCVMPASSGVKRNTEPGTSSVAIASTTTTASASAKYRDERHAGRPAGDDFDVGAKVARGESLGDLDPDTVITHQGVANTYDTHVGQVLRLLIGGA